MAPEDGEHAVKHHTTASPDAWHQGLGNTPSVTVLLVSQTPVLRGGPTLGGGNIQIGHASELHVPNLSNTGTQVT